MCISLGALLIFLNSLKPRRPFIIFKDTQSSKKTLHSFPKGPIIGRLHQKLKTTPLPSDRIDCIPFLYVDIIANILEQYSGERLSTISHTSQPWIGVALQSKISIKSIKENFGKSDFERELIEDVTKAVERAKERFEDLSLDSNTQSIPDS